jgi:FHS family Na+ dependent glucose MFS transporter 1
MRSSGSSKRGAPGGYKGSMSTQLLTVTTKRSITAGYYLLFAGIGMSGSLLGPALLSLADQTNSTLQQLGVLFLLAPLGYFLGSYAGGRLYDRIPGHKLLVIAILVMAISRIFIPLGSTVLILALLAILAGIAVGVSEVGGNTLLTWLHGDKVGAYLNGLHFSYGLGAFLGPVFVAGTIKMGFEIPKVFWFSALVIFLIGIYISFLPSPSSRVRTSEPTTEINRSKSVIKFGLLLFMAAGVEASLGGWLFTYVVTRNIVLEITASFLIAAFWGAYTLSRLLVIPFTHLRSPKILLLVCNLSCLISLLFLLPLSQSSTWIGVLGLGLFLGPIFPNLISMAQRVGINSGQSMGWLLAAGGVGAMCIPWIVSQVFEPVGPHVLLVSVGLCLLISIIFLLSINPAFSKGTS